MKYLRLDPCDLKNGDGIRVTLWLAGCSHHCPGCQNPETWDAQVWHPENWKETDTAFYELLDRYLEEPEVQGLTLSGGDPLYEPNREEVLALLRYVRKRHPGKDVWLWTGYVYEEIRESCKEILKYTDVLVDGPYLAAQRAEDLKCGADPQWRGSSNQRLLRLSDGEIVAQM
ncbi:MAG: anaerobic ribonucleoside-triphosphate reductase activating protein [Lachnospiraceae bacterium]|nr:anaerobic ribonucleoside-triphosphate reductase activating protein [Lachnospiraceae bacterium]